MTRVRLIGRDIPITRGIALIKRSLRQDSCRLDLPKLELAPSH